MKRSNNLIVGLDIGTSMTSCFVGEVREAGVELLGMGTAPSKGLKKGVVINIEATVESIKAAVDEAELMAGCEVGRVCVNISGAHVHSMNSHGFVAIKEKEVSDQDVLRVLDAAQAVAIPMDREVLHIIPQEFLIDEQDGIKEPRGMSGVRLAAKVHVVTGAVTSAQNVLKCCHQTGLTVEDMVLSPLASAEAVLTSDERELGVLLVDIGGGCTDLAIFRGGAVQHSAVISVGGDHITRDIAIGLSAPTGDAERIKLRHGHAAPSEEEAGELIQVESVGGRQARDLHRRDVSNIVRPRVEEIFSLVSQELDRARVHGRLPGGVVLTGGSTRLNGIQEAAERVLGMQVRVGVPQGLRGLQGMFDDPAFSTGVGLIRFGESKRRQAFLRQRGASQGGWFQHLVTRVGSWF